MNFNRKLACPDVLFVADTLFFIAQIYYRNDFDQDRNYKQHITFRHLVINHSWKCLMEQTQ